MVGAPSMEASLVACPEDALPLAWVPPLPGCELPLCDPEALPEAPGVWPLEPALWPPDEPDDPDEEMPLAPAPLEQPTPQQASTKRKMPGARGKLAARSSCIVCDNCSFCRHCSRSDFDPA